MPTLRIPIGALALILATSAHAAHYKVFLLGGQSNRTGNGPKTSDLTEAQKAPQDDVWIYGETDESASKLGPLQPGFGSPYGPETSFGRTIADGSHHEYTKTPLAPSGHQPESLHAPIGSVMQP